MLNAIDGHAEVRILNEAIRVPPKARLEQEGTRFVETVEPIAVVRIAIDDARLVDRICDLMNQVVVEIGNHLRLLARAE